MNDLEITKRAKMYIDKLANGINPLDNTALNENDIANNVRISRCLFFVSNILGQVIDNGGIVGKKSRPTEDFNISFEDIQKFPFSNSPISVSEIAKKINTLVENPNMKNITYKHISDWLISIDVLSVEELTDGKSKKVLTEHGAELGITTEIREGRDGQYTAILYNKSAQQFIVDNIEAILDDMRKRKVDNAE